MTGRLTPKPLAGYGSDRAQDNGGGAVLYIYDTVRFVLKMINLYYK